MSKNEKTAELYSKYVMNTYAQSVTIKSGKGTRVRDVDNMQYLDFTSGISVQNIGHCHQKVVDAVKEQTDTLMHCSNLFYNEKQPLLAERLSKIGMGGKVFFCNSGAEANEAMVKLARLWGHERGKYEVICMTNSFHGRTLGMISATGQSKVQVGFDPLLLGFAFAEYNNLESVEKLVSERTVAVMLEAVQGEGGVLPAAPEFMKGVRELCDKNGLLMLCDEVQCGVGRTGKWFGWQNYGVRPDACSMAKALASGLPIGALLTSPKLADVFQPGSHASTFGGNPVACAAALATLDVIEQEGLLENAVKIGKAFRDALSEYVDQYDDILGVRGLGLMIGLEVKGAAKDVVAAFRSMGLLACVAGEHVVRFLPPLNTSEDDLEEALDMISDAFDELYGEGEEEE